MQKLFGIPMTSIMNVLLVALGLCLLVVLIIALTNRTMFKMGLRNIPRRRSQSVLVVLGLMLATLIITAAFTVGDSLHYSITSGVYDNLRQIDETFTLKGGGPSDATTYVPASAVTALEQRFSGDSQIDGFIPAIFESVAVINPDTRQSEPLMNLRGVDQAHVAPLGGLRFADGKMVDLNALPPRSVLLNPKAADNLDAKVGSTIQMLVNNRVESFTVAGLVRAETLTGRVGGGPGQRDPGGITMPLAAAQALFNRTDQINFIGVSNAGGVRDGINLTNSVTDKLQALMDDDGARRSLGLGDIAVKVEKAKQSGIHFAELLSSAFTTIFVALGLFSIAAGMMLIFMIFVMLAAERKTEMGMARAIGLKRRGLMQSFVAEGMAYDLLAGLVGAAFGVLAAYLLVVVGMRLVLGNSVGIRLDVTPRSLIISYALGSVLTFLTVAVSAWRVSKLNIVAAIRDISDVRTKRAGKWSLIWGVIGIVLGALLMYSGHNSQAAWSFSIGITMALLALALVLRFFGFSPATVFTTIGGLIFLYWALPQGPSEKIFGKLDGNIEMFFISGIGMVIGSTLVLVYNARLLTNLFRGGGDGRVWLTPALLALAVVALAAFGVALRGSHDDVSQLLYMGAGLVGLLFVLALVGVQAPRFAPALKMAVAYPLANRFRTGMTIAMFSLIIFSITVMSTLTANFAKLLVSDDARAGWDLTAVVNRNNDLPDFVGALNEAGFNHPQDIIAVGRTTFPGNQTQARIAGKEDWKDYPIIGADDGFLQHTDAKMSARARGYESDAAVWQAVRTTPGLAVIDGNAIATGNFGGGDTLNLSSAIKAKDMAFAPVKLEIQDQVTKKVAPLTVIGVVDSTVSQAVLYGLYTNLPTYEGALGPAQPRHIFSKLAPAVDAKNTNKEIKAALVSRGVQSYDLKQELADQQQQSVGFNKIFQGFMALGLFVGVTALGVIAFRSVVERRQQIGMLRAIGYQKGTVALSFILESSFISVLGVLAGVVGASILSRNLLMSGTVSSDNTPLSFTIPWLTVIGFLASGFLFALLMTWWPARQASSVPIAEALRYE